MHVSWSEVDTARQCLQKHHLTYREGWEEKTTPQALHRGITWHALLEALYNSGEPEAPYEKLIELLDTNETDYETGELMKWMLDGYYVAYGEGDPAWINNVVLVEHEINFALPDVGYGPMNLTGYVDLVVELMGRLWLVDHKSGKNKPRANSLELADQWTIYVAALREEGYDIFGSIHSYAKTDRLKRIQTPEERFIRTPIQRTDHEVKKVIEEVTVQAWQAKLGLQGNPRSPGDHCGYRCSFLDSCIAARKWGPELEYNVLRSRHHQTDRRLNEYE